MTNEEKIEILLVKINDLYVGLNQAYSRIAALEKQTAKQPTKVISTPKKVIPDNDLGMTVETALIALDWSVNTGVFQDAMRDFKSHYKEPRGDDRTAYQNIRNRIIGTPATSSSGRFGQDWLDYWNHNYLTKSGSLRFSLGAYFMKICEIWREQRDKEELEGWGFVDEKGNWFADAEEYCKEYGLPQLTEKQLTDSGDLFPV